MLNTTATRNTHADTHTGTKQTHAHKAHTGTKHTHILAHTHTDKKHTYTYTDTNQ